jgi:hypothetical protein
MFNKAVPFRIAGRGALLNTPLHREWSRSLALPANPNGGVSMKIFGHPEVVLFDVLLSHDCREYIPIYIIESLLEINKYKKDTKSILEF